MIKIIKFESEAWICDCGKEWPEDVDVCVCGEGPPDWKEGVSEGRFPCLEFNWEMPGEYEVCPCCMGAGTTAFGYGEREQIAWTESEWAEEDPEFRHDYMRGMYDKPCPQCSGERVVMTFAEKRFSEVQQKQYDAWCKHLERGYYHDSMAEAERRFGC
jgi:hypothetical protein